MSDNDARYVQANTSGLVYSDRYLTTLKIRDSIGNSTKTISLTVTAIDALIVFLQEEKQRVLHSLETPDI